MGFKDKAKDGFVEIIFGPRWTYIATVRLFLQKFLAITLADNKKADVISIAASELLENAVKYASAEGTKISVDHLKTENKLILIVENFSDPEHVKVLRDQLEFVNEGSPEEMYLKKMQDAAMRSDGASQLGFARIRYETNALIHCTVKDDLVQIKCEIPLA